MNYIIFEGFSLENKTGVYYVHTNVYSIMTMIFNSFKGVRLFSYTCCNT